MSARTSSYMKNDGMPKHSLPFALSQMIVQILSRRTFPALAAVLSGLAMVAGCDAIFPTEEPTANQPPEVRLADNVPSPGDTVAISLVDLYWDGGDPDGFIEGYEYRIFTEFCESPCGPVAFQDTTSNSWDGWIPSTFDDEIEWTFTESTSDTISFESPAPVNRQIFQVRAIDNNGMRSNPRTLASRVFYTPNSVPPRVSIEVPEEDEVNRFALPQTNGWWNGIELAFEGSYAGNVNNQQKAIEAFGWSVGNKEDWNWTPDTSAVIGPEAFMQNGDLEGTHTIYLTARDNTGLFAHEAMGADSVTVTLVVPTFAENPDNSKDLLIIDETTEDIGGGGSLERIGITDAIVDSVYLAAFDSLDGEPLTVGTWDYDVEGGPPPRELMGQYKAAFWHADDYTANQQLPQHTEVVGGYMEVGGDFILSGFRMFSAFASVSGGPGEGTTLDEESFLRKYLHIRSATETGRLSFVADFGGVLGLGDFSDASLAERKVPTGVPVFQFRDRMGLTQIGVIAEEGSFTNPIYAYESLTTQTPTFEGETVGVQYYGTVFNAITLGFPLFYMEDEDITTLAQEMLRSIRNN